MVVVAANVAVTEGQTEEMTHFIHVQTTILHGMTEGTMGEAVRFRVSSPILVALLPHRTMVDMEAIRARHRRTMVDTIAHLVARRLHLGLITRRVIAMASFTPHLNPITGDMEGMAGMGHRHRHRHRHLTMEATEATVSLHMELMLVIDTTLTVITLPEGVEEDGEGDELLYNMC